MCVFIYLAVALSLIGPLGAVGLALANAVQNSSHALILLVLLRRSLPGLNLGRALLPFLARTIPAATVVGGLLIVAWPFLNVVGGLLGLIAAGILAGVTYTALLQALGVSEIRTIFDLARRRLSP